MVDLDTFHYHKEEALSGAEVIHPVTIFKQGTPPTSFIFQRTPIELMLVNPGTHFIVYPILNNPTDPSFGSSLAVRPIFQAPQPAELSIALAKKTPLSSSLHSEVQSVAQLGNFNNAGQLNGLGGTLLGVRNCADDLVAFDETGVLVSSRFFRSSFFGERF